MKKIAIINQRYGMEVNGGSELYTRQIAEHLAELYDVHVYTSCSIEYERYYNHYDPGIETINGVTVHRFKTLHERQPEIFTPLDEKMHADPFADETTGERWIEQLGPYCPDLIKAIKKEQDEYEAIVAVTYLYYPTFKALREMDNKLIFIPTAHDEPYIRFKLYENNFQKPNAFIFLTDEERLLVQDRFHNEDIYNEVIGIGVDVPEKTDPARFRTKYNLDNYIVYVGRIDQGKDCPRLFRYFMEYKYRNPSRIKLVLMGKAVMEIPKHEDIVSLGFVDEQDKYDGIAGSDLLVLPSKYESLSISVLEAMALSKPVIVNGRCEVLKGHCIKSNGGLYYNDYYEFEGAMNRILKSTPMQREMGFNGKNYVNDNYRWDAVINRFDEVIKYVAGEKHHA